MLKIQSTNWKYGSSGSLLDRYRHFPKRFNISTFRPSRSSIYSSIYISWKAANEVLNLNYNNFALTSLFVVGIFVSSPVVLASVEYNSQNNMNRTIENVKTMGFEIYLRKAEWNNCCRAVWISKWKCQHGIINDYLSICDLLFALYW